MGGRRRPDLIPGESNNPVLGGPDRYFDLSSFTPAPNDRYGNVGRNTLIGPGFANVDFSLVKNFPVPRVSEEFNIAFRGEFFNVFNRANFTLPRTTAFSSSGRADSRAGRITETVSTSRQIQLGLKMTW